MKIRDPFAIQQAYDAVRKEIIDNGGFEKLDKLAEGYSNQFIKEIQNENLERCEKEALKSKKENEK